MQQTLTQLTGYEISDDFFGRNDGLDISYKNLLAAVVERAVRDAFQTCYACQEHVRGARNWLTCDSEDPWSFLWVAEEISLSPKFIKIVRTLIKRPKLREDATKVRKFFATVGYRLME